MNTLNDSLDVGQWLLIMVPETCEYRPDFYVPVPPVDQVSPTHPGGLPDAQPSDDNVHIAAIAAAVAVVGDDHATDREVATDHVSLEEADEGSVEIETGGSGDSTQCDDPSDACAATNEDESGVDEAEVLDEDALGDGWEVGETLDQEQLVE